MQHNIQWTLFNTVIRQAMGTRSYTISCVYINISRLTLRALRVLVPTPSTKGGGLKRTPPVSQEREMLQT